MRWRKQPEDLSEPRLCCLPQRERDGHPIPSEMLTEGSLHAATGVSACALGRQRWPRWALTAGQGEPGLLGLEWEKAGRAREARLHDVFQRAQWTLGEAAQQDWVGSSLRAHYTQQRQEQSATVEVDMESILQRTHKHPSQENLGGIWAFFHEREGTQQPRGTWIAPMK